MHAGPAVEHLTAAAATCWEKDQEVIGSMNCNVVLLNIGHMMHRPDAKANKPVNNYPNHACIISRRHSVIVSIESHHIDGA